MINRTLSLRFRFSSVFLLVLLVVLVLGLFTIWRLTDYHRFSADVRDRYFRTTQDIGDLNNYTSDFRAAEATGLLVSTSQQKAANDAQMAELDRRISLARHSYEQIYHTPPVAQVYARFVDQWLAYRAQAEAVRALSEAGHREDATNAYLMISRASYDLASDTLGVLTNLNIVNAHDAGLRADLAYNSARQLTAIAIGFSVLLVAGGLTYMRRSIADPLLDLAHCLLALARNETAIDIPGIRRADEIGNMARAVVKLRDTVIEFAISQRALAEHASLLGEKLAAEQRLTALQRNFVSMASHEFRTPLNIIDGHAQRLVSLQHRITPAELSERALKIRSAVLRLTHVIENLIESARLIDGDARLYFHPTVINLPELLNEVCRMHREVTPRVAIQQSVEGAHVCLAADAKLLFQVFSNLISNAIKYSADDSPVELRVKSNASHVTIMVEDHGIGIPKQDLTHLFERYFRGSNVAGVIGTGIGLYLVKTVVDLHGGVVCVESDEGRGSRFTVTMPLTPANPARVRVDAASL